LIITSLSIAFEDSEYFFCKFIKKNVCRAYTILIKDCKEIDLQIQSIILNQLDGGFLIIISLMLSPLGTVNMSCDCILQCFSSRKMCAGAYAILMQDFEQKAMTKKSNRYLKKEPRVCLLWLSTLLSLLFLCCWWSSDA